MEPELDYEIHYSTYFIPQEEMDELIEFPYESPRIRYYGSYSCECGRCLSCIGLSEKDFM
jgi:hypothetical protein